MAKIVGTITTVQQYLSKNEVVLVVKPGTPNEDKIILKQNREYEIPMFQREVRWSKGNVNILLSDLMNGPRFLGNIILSIHADDICEIIDGQQRTTVLFMILECIKHKHGEDIGLFHLCPLINKSFPDFQKIVSVGFDKSKLSPEDWNKAMEGDIYKQYEKIENLWKALNESKIISDRYQAKKLVDNIKESEVNIIASNAASEDVSIRYFLDVNLKGVQLDTEDIFKGYLFSQDSRDTTRKYWQDIKQLSIRFNTAKKGKIDKRYPLMKMYEHFFYCDLYTSNPGGQDFNGAKFGENFLLTSEFDAGSTTFFEGSHIIEVICNRTYLQESLKRIKKALEIMIDVIESNNSASDKFKALFKCNETVDSIHIENCNTILQKILLDKEIIPKVLAFKYILTFLDGENHTKEEYKSIYSVFTGAVLFTVFAPKKESDTFYNFVSTHNWIEEINSWLKNYISSHDLTRGKLSVAYKCSEVDDEDITESARCKSLAAILNYASVVESGGKTTLKISNFKALYSFLHDKQKYSVEHFIVGEKGTLWVKTEKHDFIYTYPSTIKKYRNSLFNYIFISDTLNASLNNEVIKNKLTQISPKIKEIDCSYTKKYLEMISKKDTFFTNYPSAAEIDNCSTEAEAKSLLNSYFENVFPNDFLNFAMEFVKSFQF